MTLSWTIYCLCFQVADGRKSRLVILGSGWGAHSFIKSVDSQMYVAAFILIFHMCKKHVVIERSRFDVYLISPRNFFLFTPMLAGAATGTVEFRYDIQQDFPSQLSNVAAFIAD